MAVRPRIRRIARILGIALASVFGVALLAFLLLLIRPMREVVLESALQIASDSLPGRIEFESADWPTLSRLKLRGVTWREDDVQLAAADRIEVDVDLRALTRKDVHVRSLVLDGVEANVPAIQAALPAPEPATGEAAPPPFPRPGSVPGIPSVSVDSLHVEAVQLEIAEEVSTRVSLSMAVDLQAGRTPGLDIRTLDGSWLERGWTVRSDGFEIAPASAEFRGDLEADLADLAALDLSLETSEPHRFRMALRERGAATAVLELEGRFTQLENGSIDSLDYRLVLLPPTAERIEELLERPQLLAPLEPFGALRVEATGGASLAGDVSSSTDIEVTASEWPGRLDARVQQDGARVELESFTLQDAGLSVLASGSYTPESYAGRVEASVMGNAFLPGLLPAEEVPEDLRARLSLDVTGAGAELRPAAVLEGSARSAGLDSLRLESYGLVAGNESDLRVDVRALVREQLAIGVDARLTDLEQPRIHLAPIRVRERLADVVGTGPTLPDRPNLQVDPATRRIVFDDLRVTGALGEVRLDGDVSDSLGGRATLEIEWPVPPAALGLLGFDAAARDSLLAPRWTSDGVPGVEARVELPADGLSGSIDAALALPAPWTVIAGLDSAAYDAPHLRGTALASWDETRSWSADLDFAATAWLDTAFVHARGTGSTVQLDSMLVRGGPLRATAAAVLDSSSVDGKFQLDLHSHPVLTLIAPSLPEDLEFLVNLRAGVAGSPKAPDARARLLATARSPVLRLPLLSVDAEVVEGIPRSARIEIPERAQVGGFRIARALIAAQPERPDEGLFPLWLASEVDGDAQWSHTAVIDSIGSTWRVATDSLRVGAGGHVLESLGAFLFEFAPADSSMRLEGLDLAGNPGSVSASFDLGPGRARADVDAHLDGSILAALVRTPARMLPTGYHLVAKGNEDDLEASLWIEGIKLGSRNDIVARIDSRRAGEHVELKVNARDELGRLADGDVILPMRVDLVNQRFEWYDGPLTGKVTVDSLPLPYKLGGNQGLGSYLLGARDEEAPLADALLLLGGTGGQPVVGARVGVGFPQIEELRDDRLQLGAIWIGREGDAGSLGLFDADMLERLRNALPFGGIAVIGSLSRGEQQLATVRAGFPLTEASTSPFPQFGEDDPMVFAISAQPLRLDQWRAVLPRGTEVGGNLWVDVRGQGPLGDFPLDGAIRMESLYYRQSFGNSATLNGQIGLGGRSSAPVIEGVIKVPSALVRLPESERDLHPVTGDAKLWRLGLEPRDEFAALDSLQVEWGWAFDVEDSVEAKPAGLTLAESTQLDVKIDIPNSFWIRGQGLEVQLAGELHLALRDGVPIVVGELRAITGQLEVVGARLRLDRGVVTFYGGDATNPGLDLELSRNRGDVKVIVRVTGTALEPRLAFDSDPPMSQSDIMSYLLFGSSASDLDGAQTQLLQDQAASALSQFAAPMLENELTQSLGISMMQLRAGENPDEGLSLVVGKYVTPQILLKYEQSLKDRQKYTVNAEYWLTRNLRIETRLSQARSTGIELNWSTDY